MIDLDSIEGENPHKEVKFYLNPEVIILNRIIKILYTTQSINDIAKVVFDDEGYDIWLEDRFK